ncbi:MAG: ABC transporter ATP-binding protein [Phycisphaerae bacterium]|nr:ABC transporter ATP-binding protein [Phycisphaerae bacterium]
MSSNNILQVRNIHKTYKIGRQDQHVLRGVDLAVSNGEFLAIMGSSGSGKSTLLHIAGLLDNCDKGSVLFDNKDVSKISSAGQNRLRNKQIGFVFQFYHLLPELNVRENIMLPLMVGSSIFSWPGKKTKALKLANEMIEAVDLVAQATQKVTTLSGGQRQRTALARALVHKPRLLLADEPTGNLDSEAGKGILDLLKQYNHMGQTIVMVTHDPAIAAMADRTLHLRDGKLVK